MQRVLVAVLVALAACGGPNVDRDAVRDRAEVLYPGVDVDALVESFVDACRTDDDETFALVVNMAREEDANRVDLLRAGCPGRVADVLGD